MKIQRTIKTLFLGAGLAILSVGMLPKSALSEMYRVMNSMPIVINSPRSGAPTMMRTEKSPDGRYEFVSELNEPTMYMYNGPTVAYRPAKIKDTKDGKEMMVYLPIVVINK
ncbi:hypothetical protein [Argonema galeatum]|uniref:hypothetical protein n=1 Tax=Argonema galeatum TaxID=2942762 RepID=UPI00201169B6|nr:hypothetical protein [Argonema galeatum]MCL1464231.1 hypothetical protein [Argonema galeatum A003/A1]